MHGAWRLRLICMLVDDHWVVLVVALTTRIHALVLLMHLHFLRLGYLIQVLNRIHVQLCICLWLWDDSDRLVVGMLVVALGGALDLYIGGQLRVLLDLHLLVLMVLLVSDGRRRPQVNASILLGPTRLVGVDYNAWIRSMVHFIRIVPQIIPMVPSWL